MKFVLILLLLPLFLLKYVIFSKFVPAIVYKLGLPVMYLTDKGWVQHRNYSLQATNKTEIVRICQVIYPDYNITNAVPIFKSETITNWCRENETCSTLNRYKVHPIHCINSNYKIGNIIVPYNCKFNSIKHSRCEPFEYSKVEARKYCEKINQTLFDFKMVFSKFTCKEAPMHFNLNEFACCPDEDIPYSKINLQDYMKNINASVEHKYYRKLKDLLWNNYTLALQNWTASVKKDMIRIISNNQHSDIQGKMLHNLKENSKTKYINIVESFVRQILEVYKIHIKRLMTKAESHCTEYGNKIMSIKCVNHLNNVINQFKNQYNHTVQKNITDIIGYRVYLIEQLQTLKKQNHQLFRKYANLSANYNQTLSYLRSRPIRQLNEEELFLSEFNKYRLITSQNQSSGNHRTGPQLVYIIVTTFVLLFLIALTFLVTLVVRHCNQPLRRSSPNYVMSVVFKANQTSGSNPRSNQQQQLPNASSRQVVKLNLYENPIFETKSSMKPIEKQSLIENMEN